jgi:hypothetical protein
MEDAELHGLIEVEQIEAHGTVTNTTAARSARSHTPLLRRTFPPRRDYRTPIVESRMHRERTSRSFGVQRIY